MFKKIIIRYLLIILTAVYSFLFAVYLAYGYTRSIWDWSDGDEGILVIMISFSLIFLFTLLFVSIFKRRLKKNNFDKNNRVSIVLFIVLSLLLIPIIKDSPTVKNDYSLADLNVPSENAKESFKLFKKMLSEMERGDEVKLPKDLDKKKYSNVTSYKKEILDAWNKTYPWRLYVEQLNSYKSIADLTKPYVDDFYLFSGLRNLTYIYSAYAVLQVMEGNEKEGIKALAEIHSVVSKSLPCSRYVIHNILWTAIAEINIQTAYIIAADPQCSENDLILLKKQFPPLLDYDKPFSNMFISEYLFSKAVVKKELVNTDTLELLYPWFNQERKNENAAIRSFFTVLNFLTYKENSTLKVFKKYFDLFIDSPQSYRDFSAAQKYMDKYIARPSLINSSGWMLIAIPSPEFSRYVERMTNMAVKSDLLVLYIDSRLGNNTELIDRLNGQKYYKSKEPYLYFSTGIDGLPATKDDISLN